jgi:hypothetical protein
MAGYHLQACTGGASGWLKEKGLMAVAFSLG